MIGSFRDGALGEDEAVVSLDVTAAGAVALQLPGTWVGTVSFEGSVDGGTFVALNLVPSNSTVAATSSAANGVWSGNVGGYRIVRARMSAYTSGVATASLQSASSGGK